MPSNYAANPSLPLTREPFIFRLDPEPPLLHVRARIVLRFPLRRVGAQARVAGELPELGVGHARSIGRATAWKADRPESRSKTADRPVSAQQCHRASAPAGHRPPIRPTGRTPELSYPRRGEPYSRHRVPLPAEPPCKQPCKHFAGTRVNAAEYRMPLKAAPFLGGQGNYQRRWIRTNTTSCAFVMRRSGVRLFSPAP
jgi:hypothetical protein